MGDGGLGDGRRVDGGGDGLGGGGLGEPGEEAVQVNVYDRTLEIDKEQTHTENEFAHPARAV